MKKNTKDWCFQGCEEASTWQREVKGNTLSLGLGCEKFCYYNDSDTYADNGWRYTTTIPDKRVITFQEFLGMYYGTDEDTLKLGDIVEAWDDDGQTSADLEEVVTYIASVVDKSGKTWHFVEGGGYLQPSVWENVRKVK